MEVGTSFASIKVRHDVMPISGGLMEPDTPDPAPPPASVPTLNTLLPLAIEYHRSGQLDRADELYGQITSQLPNLAQVVHLRSLVAYARGQNDLAVQYASQAVALAPHNPEYHNLVGVGLYHSGRYDQAVDSFRRALSLQPEHADAMSNCALALQAEGRLHEALELAQRAVELRPDFGQGYLNLGTTHVRLGNHEQAEAAFRKTLEFHPNSPDVWRNLAHVCKELGRFEESLAAYRQVLALNPRDGHAIHGIAQLRRADRLDLPWCDQLELILQDPNIPFADRVSIHFSLGKIYEDIGHFAVAFSHYQRGNELMRSPFDRAKWTRETDVQIQHFTRDWFASRQGFGSPSESPIFIVGMFRSGTTLVEQIISTHPEVAGCGELIDIERIRGDLPAMFGQQPFPQCMNSLTATQTFALANDYLNRRRTAVGNASRFTDKMPINFLNLGLIATLFPRARIIHCVRDPRDTCLSCYTTRFSTRPEYGSDLGDLAHFYNEYTRLMDHWRHVLPLPILDVQYEDLVSNQSAMTHRILDFCGLAWDDRCLRFFENKRAIQTSSDWQVRQPMYSSAMARWKRFAHYLGPLCEGLGLPG